MSNCIIASRCYGHVSIKQCRFCKYPFSEGVPSYQPLISAYFAVSSPGDQCCQGPNNHIYLNAMHGYIASSVTRLTGCGYIDCPWHLIAPNGQQMNISLYDFAVVNVGKRSSTL